MRETAKLARVVVVVLSVAPSEKRRCGFCLMTESIDQVGEGLLHLLPCASWRKSFVANVRPLAKPAAQTFFFFLREI
jgi:hypothetical protein